MKRSRLVTPIALIVVAVGVGVYAFVDRGTVSDIERDARAGSVFPAFRRQDLSRIELVRGNETLVLVRDTSPDASEVDWRIESPVKDVADVAAVHALLSAIETAIRVRAVPGGDAPGLQDPRVRGTIAMGTVTYRFVLGDPAPTPEGAAYLKLEGEGTFVVKKELVDALLEPVSRYRPKDIVPYLSIDLASLSIDGAKAKGLSVERVDSVDFRLPSLGLRASREKLDQVWSAFGMMRAEAFLSPDAKVDAPELHVTMTPNDASKAKGELVVGGACPDHPEDVVVLRRAPAPAVAACAPKGIVAGLSLADADLVDRRLLSAHADEVVEVKLQASPSGAALEIARSAKGWRERTPEDRELDPEEVDAANTLVQEMAHAEGATVRRAGQGEKLVPHVRASFVKVEQRAPELIELAAPDAKGEILAHRLADDAILTVSADVARLFEPRATSVRGRTVWRPPVENRPVTAVSTTCGPVAQELARGDGGWVLKAPAGYAPDSAAALDLADAIARVRTEMWIADDDDGSFGLSGKGACHVAMAIDDGGAGRTVGLTIGAPSRHGEALFYARADGDPAVFVVPRSLRDMASRLLVDRSGFRADPDLASRVSISRPGARSQATLVRGDSRDFVLEDGGAKDDAENAATTLATLVADDVVHLGPPSKDEGFDHPTLEVRIDGKAADGGAAATRFVLGGVTERGGEKMAFARLDGVDATFVIAKAKVDDLLRLLPERAH